MIYSPLMNALVKTGRSVYPNAPLYTPLSVVNPVVYRQACVEPGPVGCLLRQPTGPAFDDLVFVVTEPLIVNRNDAVDIVGMGRLLPLLLG